MPRLALAVHARSGAKGDWRLIPQPAAPGVYPLERTVACVVVPKGQSLLSEGCDLRAGQVIVVSSAPSEASGVALK